MITTLPKVVKMWGRGQLTIPKDIRRAMKLDDESQLSVFVVGRCLVLTPKPLMRSALAKQAEAAMKSEKLSLDDVLETLKEERRRYNQRSI